MCFEIIWNGGLLLLHILLTYVFSLLFVGFTVFFTKYFQAELQRTLREKENVLVFHICNVVIILMVSFTAHLVLGIYLFGNDTYLILQLVILFLLTLPMYLIGNRLFEQYQWKNRKYTPVDNEKVLVLNEKYLQKKRTFFESPSIKNYNSVFNEGKPRKRKKYWF